MADWKLFSIISGSKLNTPWPLFYVVAKGGSGAKASIDWPLFSITSVTENSHLDADWPLFSVSAEGKTGTISQLSKPWPLFSVIAKGSGTGSASIDFPLFSVTALSGPEVIGSASIPWPLFGLVSQGFTEQDLSPNDYAVWVINVESKHHSTYSSWPVNSHATFNGKEIIALDDGLYEMTGNLDVATDISAKIYWAPSDLSTPLQKALESIFVRMRGATEKIRIIAIIDEKKKRQYEKDLSTYPAGNCVARVTPGRGLKGNIWQFGIENVGSGKMDFFELEAISVETKRRM